MAEITENLKEKALKFVMSTYDIYSRREALEDKWETWDKLYNSLHAKQYYKGTSTLFSPATRRCVRALLNFCDEAIWSQSPAFELKGVGGANDIKRARINTQILQLQMEKINFRRKLRDFIESEIKFGFAIAKTPYVRKEKYILADLKNKPTLLDILKAKMTGQELNKTTTIIYDNIDFIPLSPFRVYWDYYKDWYEQEAIIEKIDGITESNLRLMQKGNPESYFDIEKALEEINSGANINSDTKQSEDIMQHTAEITGLSGSYSVKKKRHELLECWGQFDIDGDGIDEECVIVVLDRKYVIRLELNPYDTQEKPYVFDKWENIEEANSLGMGVIQLAEQPQTALNDFTNQLMDNIIMILNNMWVVDRMSNIKADQLKSRPNGIVEYDGMGGNAPISPLRPPDVSTAALKGISIVKDDIYQITGATVSLQGLPARYDTTATESKQMGDSSQRDVFVKLRGIEDNVIKQFLRRAYAYNLQYLDTLTVQKILGVDAFNGYLNTQGKSIGDDNYSLRDVLMGDYDVIPLGITQLENKIVKGQQAMNLYNIAVNSPQGIWDIKALAKLVAKYIADGDMSVLSPDIEDQLISPNDENILIEQGEMPTAKMPENHMEHIQIHSQAVVSEGNEKIKQEHINQHQKLIEIQQMQQLQQLQQMQMANLQQQQTQAQKGMPAQEQPAFAPKGITPEQAGQVPNMVNPPVSLGGDNGLL